ncbi:thiamine phosphate synthase [Tenacibaculum sp. AHE15PA]|uniref:thiamine phosphate synthase n=1 Tax=unclassified Tenacibaculum TaxID=2635139 RepID=UPI001C4E83C0|nr:MULTISPECIES: thiamine phosphate synthase [unclassified Tenacibaculum]QXP72447.1 thiamine phosphate synthase [Tenacibaculum sp. AHE14PA]QXP76363.1 thiamine phosphate synthase [Tenacibaculum sp. AHE15PA]
MIVLIAPEKDVANEIEILHQLFEAGLEYYHLRKPFKDLEAHVSYLNKIDKKYHNKIIVHYFHELTNEFNLKGIHFQEQKRRDALENGNRYFIGLNMLGKTMSSSFHEPKDIEVCDIEFDYHLLSPVFSSISKKGYEGRGFNVNNIDKSIVGMGGINKETIAQTIELGFKGIGVLGGVWNAENPVESFTEIKRHYQKETTM